MAVVRDSPRDDRALTRHRQRPDGCLRIRYRQLRPTDGHESERERDRQDGRPEEQREAEARKGERGRDGADDRLSGHKHDGRGERSRPRGCDDKCRKAREVPYPSRAWLIHHKVRYRRAMMKSDWLIPRISTSSVVDWKPPKLAR